MKFNISFNVIVPGMVSQHYAKEALFKVFDGMARMLQACGWQCDEFRVDGEEV